MRFLVGNWKMQCTQGEVRSLARDLSERLHSSATLTVAVCPSFVHLAIVQPLLHASIHLGAQNCHPAAKGAFTGEISVPMLKELGVEYVIVGHSERRHGLGDSNERVAEKALACATQGLTPIVCVGELLHEREAGKAKAVVTAQLKALPTTLKSFIVAYEPVWAIGTGKAATSDAVAEMHAVIFECLSEHYGAAQAKAIPILYGGSVKPDNAASLMAVPHVQGFLVGGASLEAKTFAAIAQAMSEG